MKTKPNPRLKRIPYSGSTDSRITLADDEDIGRISGKHDKTACIAYPDELAQQIVRSVNGRERLLQQLDEAHEELTRRRAKKGQLKPIDLTAISRTSDLLFTQITFEDFDLKEALSYEKDGVKHQGVWLKFGECCLSNEGRSCYIGGRIHNDIRDFEHDTPYVVRINLVGLQYLFTDHHISHFEAHITPNPEDIHIYPEGFDPKAVEGSWECDRCDNKHLMLPDGYFTAPQYELAHVVAGKRISIAFGPRWDVIDKDED